MDRLTKRDGRIAVHVGGCTKRADPVFEKLAQYEDLEESGRLVILPEGFDREKALDYLHFNVCPSDFGLKGKFKSIYECEENNNPCEDCWETALKGGLHDNR